jgi:hypothetical protein
MTEQPNLFGAYGEPLARISDPITSHRAAARQRAGDKIASGGSVPKLSQLGGQRQHWPGRGHSDLAAPAKRRKPRTADMPG